VRPTGANDRRARGGLAKAARFGYRSGMRILAPIALAFLLAGCGTVAKGTADTAVFATKTTAQGVGLAAQVPMEDLNLKRAKIPKALRRLETAYPAVPPDNCFMVDFEIRELDAVLGPDEDDPQPVDDRGMFERAGDGMESLAVQGVRDLAADQIPFRSIVRRATGATAHERKLREAYDRGVRRRTYLKGLGDAMGCDEARVKRELYEDEKRKKFLGVF
jgi:hypothetical protein